MKINSYCIDCKKDIKYYNKAKRCWECNVKFRQQDAKWLKKNCIDCNKELKNKMAKRCKTCQGKTRQKNYFCEDCGKKVSTCNTLKCRNCYKKWSKIPENNPMYIDGRNKEEYGAEFDSTLKEKVRFRDKYKCQICGCSQLENGSQLDVHHKDTNKKNNNINNLVALCKSCHTKLHNKIRLIENGTV